MSIKDRILSSVSAVPSLPSSAIEVVKLANNPAADVAGLRHILERDPGLTANVLHLANSAAFGSVGEISTVQDAIVRLGMKRVFQLVMSSALAPLACPPVKGYDLPPGALLRHCVATGLAAVELAGVLGIPCPPQAFTAGLLHDVGKIILGTFLEVDVAPIMHLAFHEGVSFEQAERQVLGINHAEAGATLLEGWSVPRIMTDVVHYHHEPEAFPGDDTVLVDLVHVADELARLSGMGTGSDGLNYTHSEKVLARLNITTNVAERVISKVLDSSEELSRLFDPGVGEA